MWHEYSIVSWQVAASYDPFAYKYNMLYRLQGSREEMIQDLENIMKTQLLFFHKQNRGLKPERILYYRDGVSEGQFQEVRDIMLGAKGKVCYIPNFGNWSKFFNVNSFLKSVSTSKSQVTYDLDTDTKCSKLLE